MGNTNEFKTAVDQYLAFSHGQQPNGKKEYYKTPYKKKVDYYGSKALLMEETNEIRGFKFQWCFQFVFRD